MNVWSFDVVFSEDITNGKRSVIGQVVLAGETLFSTDVSRYIDFDRNESQLESAERRVMEQFAQKLKDVLQDCAAP